MAEEVIEDAVKSVVKAYEFIIKELGVELPEDLLRQALSEAAHIIIHELTHAAILKACPEVVRVSHEDPELGECINEVGGRILERYVSLRINAPAHTFEEHAHEVKHSYYYYYIMKLIDWILVEE